VRTSGTLSLSACDDAASVVTRRNAVRGVAKALRLIGRAMLLRATLENILVGTRREMDGGGRELFVVVELVGQCPKLWDSELKAWTFWRFLFSIFDQPHLTSTINVRYNGNDTKKFKATKLLPHAYG
jgi:hypothetical protein